MVGSLLAVEMPVHGADAGLINLSGAPSIVVRTYTQAHLEGDARTARSTAASILERAGIQVDWISCDTPEDVNQLSAVCRRPLRSNELVLRVLPAGVADQPSDESTLGFAFVDVGTGGGSLATVYSDRVVGMAQRSGVNVDDLLGKAIAHEIGHLLLGTNRHTSQGLMRASWTGADLRRNLAIEWLFDGKEAEALRRGVFNRVER
jgi:hypothetical protein